MKAALTKELNNIINSIRLNVENPIIVLQGITPYIDLDEFEPFIDDSTNFDLEKNGDVYSLGWVQSLLPKIFIPKEFHILSHQQFSYLLSYSSPELFVDRAYIIYDNLRVFFPISKDMYIETDSDAENADYLDKLPIYHAEHVKFEGAYYYSFKKFDDSLKYIPFFTIQKELDEIKENSNSIKSVDLSSDSFACDFFLNECIVHNDFSRKIAIKTYQKNVLTKNILDSLKCLNHLLSRCGGGVFIYRENDIPQSYVESEDALFLLRKYWAENASFRNINVYKNPDIGRETIPISQGLIVDTIIKEYENGRNGIIPRDVFVTAPTGAGKSLLFQIPAFYASDKGDVTIVVSPLIALMCDQVTALQYDRHFHKAEYLNSDLSLVEREKIIEQCKDGDTDILYLSPELLLSYDIRYFIGERNLGLLIIDEAHLISTWGRDFRIDYWFLGTHVNKIRKYSNRKFPIVAVTATAVYGGGNDMVFDTISSLFMNDPHKFIGEVRRSNIEFVIDTHDKYGGAYDKNKIAETVDFIKKIKQINKKTIVYAPFRKHINDIKFELESNDLDIAVAYHSGLSQEQRHFAENSFKHNDYNIMVCTKAFGMGVDIPDIEVVYHHAPSGLLPDYIQEIGRVARKQSIRGIAALTFAESDLKYSKILFGLSSIKTFQIQEVLRKIYKHYIFNNKKRRMLLSTNDFAYIFDDAEDIDQKVSSALMMIEKDYLAKYRFNVLVARPKKLFSSVYARIPNDSLRKLRAKYGNYYEELNFSQIGDNSVIKLKLDELWQNHFSDKSFPQIKNEFYRQKLLEEEKITITPILKVTFYIEEKSEQVAKKLDLFLSAFKSALSTLKMRGKFFKEEDLKLVLQEKIPFKCDIARLTTFILNSYAGKQVDFGRIEDGAFLQRRRINFTDEYQVFNSRYEGRIARLTQIFASLFGDNEYSETSRFLSYGSDSLKEHIRLGSFLEILRIGYFDSKGGDDPKVFIYINDPRKIRFDSEYKDYKNSIVESIKQRHGSSTEIFAHFFTNYFTNQTRWDFIEDFFLGMSKEELFDKYPEGYQNHVDILEYIKNNSESNDDVNILRNRNNTNDFEPKKGKIYKKSDYLCIDNKIKKVSQWVTEDPVLLHRSIVSKDYKIESDYYDVLVSRLKAKYTLYYRDFMGLKLQIDFPGYKEKVVANIPYQEDPIKFYKWWKQNTESVTLTKKEQLELFNRVYEVKPTTLLLKHLKLIQ